MTLKILVNRTAGFEKWKQLYEYQHGNIYSYLGTSNGQSSNLYLNVKLLGGSRGKIDIFFHKNILKLIKRNFKMLFLIENLK